MLGAVGSTWLLVDLLGAQSPSSRNWLLLIGVILLALVFGAFLGALMEKLIFERLLETNVLTPLIASIGLSFILQNLGLKWNGSGKKKFETVFPDSSPYIDLDSVLSRTPLVIGLAVPILLLAIMLLKFTPFGLAIRATSEDANAARLCGVDVKQATTFAYALAGALASAGGVIYAQESSVVNYDLGRTIGLVALASAIIGGIGTLSGAIVGGIAVGLIESLSIGLPAGLGGRWSHSAIFGVLIVVLVYRPEGLVTRRKLVKINI
jgi:branched-chain amino acid transport system permease protein